MYLIRCCINYIRHFPVNGILKIALILSSLGRFASEVTLKYDGLTRMSRKIENFGKQLARNLRDSTHPFQSQLYPVFVRLSSTTKHIIRMVT